jgi:uncharacterized DUF497 family protein
VNFTWDPAKATSNKRKHGVTFEEARTVFDDPHVMVEGQGHASEPRLVALGYSARSRVLIVIVAEVAYEEIRIISARRAEKHERKEYEHQAR